MSTRRALVASYAAAILTAVSVGGCGQPPNGALPIAQPPIRSSPTPAGSEAVEATVPVYYLGEERIWREEDLQPVDRIRLYREFHRVPAGDGGDEAKTAAAITATLAEGSAFDPDYFTGWPAAARLREVSIDADTVTIDLSGAATNSVGAEAAQQAVQQLVWTATAASGKPGVRLLLDGEPVSELWGHVSVDGVLKRAAPLDTVALVWLIDPQHGATVPTTFTVHVSGAPYESTVYLRVRQGDRTVSQTFVTLASVSGDRFGEAKTTMTLPPGSYIIEASGESAVGVGSSALDDHTITVG
jgi:Sporulation and spore germination/Immunoglobulin-like domain of bacterial spore germination